MKVNIHFHQLSHSKMIIEHIDHRMSFAFSRTKHEIDSASITLSDVNGPRGGIDKQCLLVVKPKGLAHIVISEQQTNLPLAINRCLSRGSQSLVRQLKRKRQAPRRTLIPKNLVMEKDTVMEKENQQYLT